MEHPLVSVLVPIYGVENYIARCGISLFEQTYENMEFIFVDDCTKDNSMKVLQQVMGSYPNRIEQVHIIKHEHNKGLASARNTAVAAAHGKYLMHVDSDDFLIEPNAVELLVNICESDNLDLCFFDGKNYFKEKTIPYSEDIPDAKEECLKKLLMQSLMSTIWGQLIKTSLYTENNIKCIEGINFGEDYCVKPLLLYHAERYAHVKIPLYGYNQQNESSYTFNFSINHSRQYIRSIDHLFEQFELRGASIELLDCLRFAKLKAKARLLNRWLYSGENAADFKEIKNIKANNKFFKQLPFKYKVYLSIASIFPAHICKVLYRLLK